MGHSTCCVVNCKNNGKNGSCKFYSFPTSKWTLQQRQKWIAAVKRKKSPERRPLLDIGFPQASPNDRFSASIHRIPATLTRSSVHLVGGLPKLRLPARRRHSGTFRPQWKNL
ncbi:hypothetical protein PYW08_010136 [Mythimna loreyi]|uniref:Uncharacterized protein n=1 Tax=Mythimna loreyi TaxID=667449 RepID=A0ACC2Q7Z6_9NEOP|nr:hypothetical protein PYW08_010136 [Mythimna loreyi]